MYTKHKCAYNIMADIKVPNTARHRPTHNKEGDVDLPFSI